MVRGPVVVGGVVDVVVVVGSRRLFISHSGGGGGVYTVWRLAAEEQRPRFRSDTKEVTVTTTTKMCSFGHPPPTTLHLLRDLGVQGEYFNVHQKI